MTNSLPAERRQEHTPQPSVSRADTAQATCRSGCCHREEEPVSLRFQTLSSEGAQIVAIQNKSSGDSGGWIVGRTRRTTRRPKTGT